MSRVISRAAFFGVDVRVIEREVTVFTHPTYQNYFHPNHRLLLVSVNDDCEHLVSGYWILNLVSTVSGILPPGYRHTDRPDVRVVDKNDVVVDIRLETRVTEGYEVDDVILTMYNVRTTITHYQHFPIHHGASPRIPAAVR